MIANAGNIIMHVAILVAFVGAFVVSVAGGAPVWVALVFLAAAWADGFLAGRRGAA